MKRILSVCFVVIFVGINWVQAKDLVVTYNGYNGTYSTIQAAVNAATAGDRILVENRGVSNSAYQTGKDIEIAKDITIMASPTALKRPVIADDIIAGADVKIRLKYLDIKSNRVSDVTGHKLSLEIFDCIANNVYCNNLDSKLILVHSVVRGELLAHSGKIIGSNITKFVFQRVERRLTYVSDLIVIGNSISEIANSESIQQTIHFYGNELKSSFALPCDGNSKFSNNTIVLESATSNNNILSLGDAEIMNNALRLQVYIGSGDNYYNIFNKPENAAFNHIYVAQEEAYKDRLFIKNWGAQYTKGKNVTPHKGAPMPAYSNLDRTRNTQGKSGGSFPFEMYYHPAGTSEEISLPTVFYINLLNNRVNPGETIDIEAEAKTGK
ncbi:hypothetical protein FUAX_19110 [Fulvitalea axinellae]|uniref:Periplasmic copper-binding protein NosD beta helix domain-containing protein n=1 Tax=Fulvitalea axinellae TaxID=1182444 RepID=A0AAU9CBI7_9BACT|nr:hypothetical protein FUAX_19110 [Fulvitalea axinellae]